MQNQKFKEHDSQGETWKNKRELVGYKGDGDELLVTLIDKCRYKHQADHTVRKEWNEQQNHCFRL